ncbi:phospholipase D-like domain-containing protein DpdK [Streptomyces polygonati]|uniref:Phospholipase D-like domain-containing protein DpdK n=1 Tax=Streptomyces polygonati TaxID=1617087 RepID=A0ABV8HRE2_9ACTN
MERKIRTGEHTGVKVDSVLAAAMLAALIAPDNHLWLVSPWITDVQVLDNSDGAYDSLFGGTPPQSYRLSETLNRIAANGTRVHVVTRAVPHNDDFLRRLHRTSSDIEIHIDEDLNIHEKTLCAGEWIIDGSMNFTIRGMAKNDESVTYKVGGVAAAQARLDLSARWEGGA